MRISAFRATIILIAVCGGLAAQTRYYLVEGVMELPGGRRVGISASLIRRTVDREAGKIEETVLSFRGQDPAMETVTLIRPEGEKAVMTSDAGGFSGEGRLSGPEWAWTHMTFTAKLEKGGEVQGEDEFSPEAITAVKKVLGGDGKLQIVIRESGKSINEALYQLLRSRLLK